MNKTAHICLDPKFKRILENTFEFDTFTFGGGESHIKFKHLNFEPYSAVTITQRINNSKGLMDLLLATDAIRQSARYNKRNIPINVVIPYIPYARQDRVMVYGEPFSLKVFANIINSQNYNRVICLDPHSEAAGLLINNLEDMTPYWILDAAKQLMYDFKCPFVMVSPDGGALKKIHNTAKWVRYNDSILCATKIRDLNTGNIVRTTIDMQDVDLKGKTAWIVDDICAGGRTFQELAKVLKAKGAEHVVLSVSHYEGTANIFQMKEAGIDKIYTTNSIRELEGEINEKFIKQYLI